MSEYQDFIKSKQRRPSPLGFEPTEAIPSQAFDWQREIIEWAVRRGRAALLEGCGLGKTMQQLAWADQVVRHANGKVILHCPVGVRHQTLAEASKFGIADVRIVNRQSEVRDGISLVNYEKMHHFDPSEFIGVVLDESSILKSFTGKIKRQLCSSYAHVPYRLACTATAAPNDFMELGNHADFLGVLPSNEMLSRFFINDTMKAGGYRLKKHGVSKFWDWVASWGICVESPSDIGHDDGGFVLPPLNTIEHVVEHDESPDEGWLFHRGGPVTATTIHREKRKSADARAAKVADLVLAEPDLPWIIWCDTDYEADALKTIPNTVEIRGSHSEQKREDRLQAFSDGEIKRLITKPTVAGFGMNWQHCNRAAFIGLSFSYEQFYQATRRIWRFGQTKPVDVHVISTIAEDSARKAIIRKQSQHNEMKRGMALSMKSSMIANLKGDLERDTYSPEQTMEVPEWLSA